MCLEEPPRLAEREGVSGAVGRTKTTGGAPGGRAAEQRGDHTEE